MDIMQSPENQGAAHSCAKGSLSVLQTKQGQTIRDVKALQTETPTTIAGWSTRKNLQPNSTQKYLGFVMLGGGGGGGRCSNASVQLHPICRLVLFGACQHASSTVTYLSVDSFGGSKKSSGELNRDY
eukprot:1144077-Pelagomonas_calceolata.AAC.7